jgi:hypothetical protein
VFSVGVVTETQGVVTGLIQAYARGKSPLAENGKTIELTYRITVYSLYP